MKRVLLQEIGTVRLEGIRHKTGGTMQENLHQYEDIIDLPHYVSKKHPRMSTMARAAQFAPFAALTGYEDAINETARFTDQKMELDENKKAELDEKMGYLLENLKKPVEEREQVTFTWFQKDARKEGGTYIDCTEKIKRINTYTQRVTMMDETQIAMEDIVEIQIGVL